MRLAGCRWMPSAALSLLMTGALVAPAPAATRDAAVQRYVVDGVRDSLDRSAVVATGAAIVEVDHAAVIVTASASDVRKLRKIGRYRVSRYAEPRTPKSAKGGLQARAAAFPAADSQLPRLRRGNGRDGRRSPPRIRRS